jgi:hypothetical protein
MLESASDFGGMRFDTATDEQAMMIRIQTRGVWNGPARDWPLRVYGALLEIDRRNVAVTVHNISHRDIQFLAGRLDYEPGGRLHKALVLTKKATNVSAGASGYHDPGVLEVLVGEGDDLEPAHAT